MQVQNELITSSLVAHGRVHLVLHLLDPPPDLQGPLLLHLLLLPSASAHRVVVGPLAFRLDLLEPFLQPLDPVLNALGSLLVLLPAVASQHRLPTVQRTHHHLDELVVIVQGFEILLHIELRSSFDVFSQLSNATFVSFVLRQELIDLLQLLIFSSLL